MNCTQFEALLPRYPDDLTDEAERAAFLLHAAECPACAARLAEQEALLLALETVDDAIEAPPAFSQGWRRAVRAEAGKKRTPWYARWQGWTVAAAAVVLVISGTALMRAGKLFPSSLPAETATKALYAEAPLEAPAAGGADAYSRSAGLMDMEATSDEAADAVYGEADSGVARKTVLLRSASITLDTTRFDADLDRVSALLETAGGWVEYQTAYGEPLAANPEGGRYAYMRLRVPEEALDGLIDGLRGIGTVQSVETTAEDVSDSYYDVQGRVAMYTAQRDRMTELLAQAEDMADIIEIESRLSELQYTIESLTARLNNWDARSENAVLTVSMTEVAEEGEYARLSLGQRIQEGFANSLLSLKAFLADIVVFLVMAAPYLIPLCILAVAGYCLYRGLKKKKQKEREQQ